MKNLKRKLKYGRRYFFYLLIKVLIWFIQRLSFEQAQNLGRALGEGAYYFAPQLRRLGRSNLDIGFGATLTPREKEKILFSMFQHFGAMALEWIQLPTLSKEEICSYFINDQEATEKLIKIYKKYQKLIILTPHLGNWELGGAWFSAKILLYVVARRVYYEPLNQLIVELREKSGIKTIYSRENPKKFFRILKEKAAIALLPDQHLKRMAGIWIPFFGKDAFTITGPATLSLATQTPLVPMFAIRHGKKYIAIIEEPLNIPQEGTREERIRVLTIAWTKVFEKYISTFPHQWAWIHRRWRERC